MFFMSRWSGGLVRRYGPRLPLITGPLIVTAGFVLFAIPGQHGSYWTTFFPPFVVLGLGMAVTVAPLTTVVMSSVERNHAGAASGINNAIARVAGVLAIAIFGTVMVQAFGLHLQRSIRDMNLPANVVTDIKSNVIKLGALDVPHNVDQGTATTIRADITRSFIYGFRLIMAVCAGLALASAAVARLMISSARRKTT